MVELFIVVCGYRMDAVASTVRYCLLVCMYVYTCILYIERKIHTFPCRENSLLTPGGVLHDACRIFHMFEMDAVNATVTTINTNTVVAVVSAFRFKCFRVFFVAFCWLCVQACRSFRFHLIKFSQQNLTEQIR